jgi:alternate signal-mediated exported protein
MNKMAKGVIATGVGIILLAGGGGTLATWNQAENASMGSVVAGDLNLTALAGTWKNAKNEPITNIAAYKVVPGEVLTFTQNLDVILKGNLMAANLTVTGLPEAQTTNEVTVATVLTQGAVALPSTLTQANADGKTVTATTTFTFNQALGTLGDPVLNLQAVNKTYNLAGIGYKLVQLAPDATPVP